MSRSTLGPILPNIPKLEFLEIKKGGYRNEGRKLLFEQKLGGVSAFVTQAEPNQRMPTKPQKMLLEKKTITNLYARFIVSMSRNSKFSFE